MSVSSKINELYQEGEAVSHAGWLLSGFKRFLPSLRRDLVTAQQFYNNWVRDPVPFRAVPMPWGVAKTLAAAACEKSHHDLSLLPLLGYAFYISVRWSWSHSRPLMCMWIGVPIPAGRRGNRGNSLRRASLGGSETAWDGAIQHVGRRGNWWEGARQHAGRRRNRGNSLRRASLGGSETACWTERKPCKEVADACAGKERDSIQAVEMAWGELNAELLVRLFQSCWHRFSGHMSSLRLSWKIVGPRLVKWSQDRSNGFQRLKNGTCTAKRLLLEGISFCKKPWTKVVGRG